MQYPFYTVYALAIFTDKPPFRSMQAFTADNAREARKQAISHAQSLTDVIIQDYGKAGNLMSWAVVADINLGLDQAYYVYQQGGLNDSGAMQLLAKEYPTNSPDILQGWAKEYEYYNQQGQGQDFGTMDEDGTTYKVLPEVIEQLNANNGTY
ncbi:MAG: hypothetical protein EOP56_18045 [Sphingobacteriales bacterium]|nr:MAG: hypothetical protein EOP56_18045 [Sphingobacteriales bacterium]